MFRLQIDGMVNGIIKIDHENKDQFIFVVRQQGTQKEIHHCQTATQFFVSWWSEYRTHTRIKNILTNILNKNENRDQYIEDKYIFSTKKTLNRFISLWKEFVEFCRIKLVEVDMPKKKKKRGRPKGSKTTETPSNNRSRTPRSTQNSCFATPSRSESRTPQSHNASFRTPLSSITASVNNCNINTPLIATQTSPPHNSNTNSTQQRHNTTDVHLSHNSNSIVFRNEHVTDAEITAWNKEQGHILVHNGDIPDGIFVKDMETNTIHFYVSPRVMMDQIQDKIEEQLQSVKDDVIKHTRHLVKSAKKATKKKIKENNSKSYYKPLNQLKNGQYLKKRIKMGMKNGDIEEYKTAADIILDENEEILLIVFDRGDFQKLSLDKIKNDAKIKSKDEWEQYIKKFQMMLRETSIDKEFETRMVEGYTRDYTLKDDETAKRNRAKTKKNYIPTITERECSDVFVYCLKLRRYRAECIPREYTIKSAPHKMVIAPRFMSVMKNAFDTQVHHPSFYGGLKVLPHLLRYKRFADNTLGRKTVVDDLVDPGALDIAPPYCEVIEENPNKTVLKFEKTQRVFDGIDKIGGIKNTPHKTPDITHMALFTPDALREGIIQCNGAQHYIGIVNDKDDGDLIGAYLTAELGGERRAGTLSILWDSYTHNGVCKSIYLQFPFEVFIGADLALIYGLICARKGWNFEREVVEKDYYRNHEEDDEIVNWFRFGDDRIVWETPSNITKINKWPTLTHHDLEMIPGPCKCKYFSCS